MLRILLIVYSLMVTLAVAVLGLLFPHRLKEQSMRKIRERPFAYHRYRSLIESPNYVLQLRITGLLALFGFLFVIYVLIYSSPL